MADDPFESLRDLVAKGHADHALDSLVQSLRRPGTSSTSDLRRSLVMLRSTLSDIQRRRGLGLSTADDARNAMRVNAALLDIVDECERSGIPLELPAPPAGSLAVSAVPEPPAAASATDEQVFVSYSRKDRERAAAVVAILRARGWSVFWDPQIVPGIGNWDRFLERKLNAAHCIVVLWSEASAASEYVRIEAHQGRNRGILVAATLDGTIPVTFALVQTQDLTGWAGDTADSRIADLCVGVARLLA